MFRTKMDDSPYTLVSKPQRGNVARIIAIVTLSPVIFLAFLLLGTYAAMALDTLIGFSRLRFGY